jgi:hypothetical protein
MKRWSSPNVHLVRSHFEIQKYTRLDATEFLYGVESIPQLPREDQARRMRNFRQARKIINSKERSTRKDCQSRFMRPVPTGITGTGTGIKLV